LGLATILVAAKIGGGLFERLSLPPVLGELIFGAFLGNAGLIGIHFFEGLRTDPSMDLLARIGVVVLLFEVGLIFASIGRGLGVVDDVIFSAIVMMVIVTTLVTPPLLKWRLEHRR